MEKIISFHQDFYPKLYKLHDCLAEILGVKEGDTPVKFLAMALSSIIQDYELAGYYYSIWSGERAFNKISLSKTPITPSQIVEENSQRLIDLSKSTFIQIISSLEFCLKEIALENFPKELQDKASKKRNNDIHLMDVMDIFEEKNIIDKNEKKIWRGINIIRNKIVHNNCVAQEDLTLEFEIENLNYYKKDISLPKRTIILKKNEMIQGESMLFYELIGWIIRKYYFFTVKTYLKDY